MFQQNEKDSLS